MPLIETEAVASAPSIRRRLLRYLTACAAAVVLWIFIYANLQPVAGWITHRLLNLERGTHLASSVEFFVFEAPKVLLLLVVVVFGVGILRSFFTPERTRHVLAGRRESTGNVLAALLGIVTPFCSCSAVPLFIGFVSAGVPLGVTFSFLISAPMVNEVALVLHRPDVPECVRPVAANRRRLHLFREDAAWGACPVDDGRGAHERAVRRRARAVRGDGGGGPGDL